MVYGITDEILNVKGFINIMDSLKEHFAYTYGEAAGYLKTLERSLIQKSKFNNELLYNIVAMCTEKIFMTYLLHKGKNAIHHTPMALFNEVDKIYKLPENYKDTAKLIGKFESICLIDAFGYKTPTSKELTKMIEGLIEIKRHLDLTINNFVN
jgi:hypothetical protein